MPQNCTLKNGQNGKFYAHFTTIQVLRNLSFKTSLLVLTHQHNEDTAASQNVGLMIYSPEGMPEPSDNSEACIYFVFSYSYL
jgi:hypothetical protein